MVTDEQGPNSRRTRLWTPGCPQPFTLLLVDLLKAFGSIPPLLLSQLIWGRSANIFALPSVPGTTIDTKNSRSACWLMMPTNGVDWRRFMQVVSEDHCKL